MTSSAKAKHLSPSPGRASCSICLEAVECNGQDRSVAKLKCGHQFHLDCIGSAFNAKGAMQCPNCRQVEQGQWLYASGCYPAANVQGVGASEEDLDNHVGVHVNLFYLHDERLGHMTARPPQVPYHGIPVSHRDSDYLQSEYERALVLLPSERNRWENRVSATTGVDQSWASHEVGGPWNGRLVEVGRTFQPEADPSFNLAFPTTSQIPFSRVHNWRHNGESMLSAPNNGEVQLHRQWIGINNSNSLGPPRHLLNRGSRERLQNVHNRRLQGFGTDIDDNNGLRRRPTTYAVNGFIDNHPHPWGGITPRSNVAITEARFRTMDTQGHAEGVRNPWW